MFSDTTSLKEKELLHNDRRRYFMSALEDLATREFHPHQYVKVAVTPTKTEIGIVVSADENTAVVATRHGYNITVKPRQLQRAFLLVLDLNGVLGARQRKTVFEKRPHLERFLKFALTNFVVSVWTSCEERNGKQIVEDIFGDDRDRLLFCLYRSDCTPNPTVDRPFGTIKNLQRIFDAWPESFHAVNTVIVDDSADKCSHPDIALCPPGFSGLTAQPDDDGLLQTIAVLEKVLLEDSLSPLIAAAQTRKLAEAAEASAVAAADSPVAMPQAVATSSPPRPLCDGELHVVSASKMKAETDKRTLCCHFAVEKTCSFGAQCRFSHTDDGLMLCSRVPKCNHHSGRRGHVASSVSELRLSDGGHARLSMNNFAAALLAKLNDGEPAAVVHAPGTEEAVVEVILGSPSPSKGVQKHESDSATPNGNCRSLQGNSSDAKRDGRRRSANRRGHGDEDARHPRGSTGIPCTGHPPQEPSVVALLQNAHRALSRSL